MRGKKTDSDIRLIFKFKLIFIKKVSFRPSFTSRVFPRKLAGNARVHFYQKSQLLAFIHFASFPQKTCGKCQSSFLSEKLTFGISFYTLNWSICEPIFAMEDFTRWKISPRVAPVSFIFLAPTPISFMLSFIIIVQF